MTPVHIAAIHGNVALLRCLLEAKGDPTIKCKLGTAMDLAVEHKHINVEQLLKDFATMKRKRTSSNMRSSGVVQRPQTQPMEIERCSSDSTLVSNKIQAFQYTQSTNAPGLFTLHTPPGKLD